MQAYFTDEPLIRTMQNDSSGFANYAVCSVTGMQGDTVLNGGVLFTNTAYAPDWNGDIEFGSLLRTMITNQERNLKTLQYWNSQGMGLTQSTFAFNTYFSIVDNYDSSQGRNTSDYSILFDTRRITTDEAGCTYYHSPYRGYPANMFPDPYIAHGQYISIMWRSPSNFEEMATYSLGETYCYITNSSAGRQASKEQIDDARATIESATKNTGRQEAPPDPSVYGSITIATRVIDSSITGQSFRYSGTADWQEWSDGHGGVLWARFWIADAKGTKTYLTPYLYPKWCDDPNVVYLFWVNSMGGIDFVRSTSTIAKSINHEDSTYETGIGIDERRSFGEEIYHQRKWDSYTFNTSLVTEEDSPALADICGARWAWLYFPGQNPLWKSVTVEDSKATVKTYENQGKKFYNYTFQLRDNMKVKTI